MFATSKSTYVRFFGFNFLFPQATEELLSNVPCPARRSLVRSDQEQLWECSLLYIGDDSYHPVIQGLFHKPIYKDTLEDEHGT